MESLVGLQMMVNLVSLGLIGKLVLDLGVVGFVVLDGLMVLDLWQLVVIGLSLVELVLQRALGNVHSQVVDLAVPE